MELNLFQALHSGLDAHRAGRYSDAESYYRAVLKAEPDHPEANHGMGALAAVLGKIEFALPYYEKAVSSSKFNSKYWESLISAHIELGQNQEAERLLNEAAGIGVKGKKLKKIRKRLSVSDSKVSRRPKKKTSMSEVLNHVARLLNERNFSEAILTIQETLENSPETPVLRNFLGVAFSALNRHSEAVDQLLKSVYLDPQYLDGWINLAVSQYRNGNIDEAIRSYQKALDISPNDPECFFYMGNLFREKGHISEAIIAYQKAIQAKPDFADAFYNLGLSLGDQENKDGAVENYRNVIKIRADYAEAFFNIGVILEERGCVSEAAVEYRNAMAARPSYAPPHYNLAAILMNTSMEDALKLYQTATGLDPENGEYVNALANCYYEMNDLEMAEKFFLESVGKVWSEDVRGTKAQIAEARSLECLFRMGRYQDFNERLKSICQVDKANIRVAAISAWAATQLRQDDAYPFCKNSIEFIEVTSLRDRLHDADKFLDSVIVGADKIPSYESPKKHTTVGGTHTIGNIFETGDEKIKELELYVRKEIDSFYRTHKSKDCFLIKHWPSKIKITGWFIRLRKGGYQTTHIHPDAWVSGVVYLKTVDTTNKSQGGIEFSLQGYGYPDLDQEYPSRVISPRKGDVVIFPSDLFHSTIPFDQETERCVIAFDVLGKPR